MDLRLSIDGLVPPQITVVIPVHVLAGAADDEDVAHLGAVLHRLVDDGFDGRGLALAIAAVGGDDELDSAVLDAVGDRRGGEAAEDDGVRGAEAGAGEHGEHRLRDHRHVDRNAVAGLDSEFGERIRGLRDLAQKIGVRDGAGVSGFAFEVVGHAIAEAVLDMAIDAVVCGIEPSAHEPLRKGPVRPVEDRVEGSLPADALCLFLPIADAVGGRLLVFDSLGIGCGGEVRWGWERPVLVAEFLNRRIVRHRALLSPCTTTTWAGHRTHFQPTPVDSDFKRCPQMRKSPASQSWTGKRGFLVAPTGVDPVTFRFSVERSTN